MFAISIDKLEFNASIAPRPMLMNYREEPVIQVPVPGKLQSILLLQQFKVKFADNKSRKDRKNKRKVARQIISFDEDDSMLSTSVPSISSTSSDSSSIGKQSKDVNETSSNLEMEKPQPNDNTIRESEISSIEYTKSNRNRKLSVENSGSRSRFSSSVPESLTPINHSNIGELTPVSVERIRG